MVVTAAAQSVATTRAVETATKAVAVVVAVLALTTEGVVATLAGAVAVMVMVVPELTVAVEAPREVVMIVTVVSPSAEKRTIIILALFSRLFLVITLAFF